jgi:uncharacterized FlgJ-related protein
MSIETQVYQAAIKNGMPAPLAALITAQSKHESSNYTSNVFLKNNNLFGYKYAGQKIATRGTPAPSSEGINGAYAKYANIGLSVQELTDWIKRRQKEKKFPTDLKIITSPELYASLLKTAGYYGASVTQYITGLKRFLNDNLPAAGISAAALAAIATGVFFC